MNNTRSHNRLKLSQYLHLNNSIILQIVFAICLFHINIRVKAWGYPEDNCYNCYADVKFGDDGMYFCRHNSSGLIWG